MLVAMSHSSGMWLPLQSALVALAMAHAVVSENDNAGVVAVFDIRLLHVGDAVAVKVKQGSSTRVGGPVRFDDVALRRAQRPIRIETPGQKATWATCPNAGNQPVRFDDREVEPERYGDTAPRLDSTQKATWGTRAEVALA